MTPTPTTRRDGAVLLVVLAMLALFAVIGLSFVFYAESRATSARIYREAQEQPSESPDPQHLMAFSQLIYGVTDGTSGVYSGLRGHDLARAMYGFYYEGTNPDDPIVPVTANAVPYGGVGPVPGHAIKGVPLINYTWSNGSLLLDPERTGQRAQPIQTFGNASRYVGKNEPVTYPTTNDVVVGLVNPVNGNVLVPSLHRPWVFNGGANYAALNERQRQLGLAPPGTPGKPLAADGTEDWVQANGKYRIIRPRPIDHGNFFPYPPPNDDGTYTGDVQNLPGAAYPFLDPATGAPRLDANNNPILIAKNDSVWVDIGAPVQIWNGRRVKPLFAFLVVPTNNRVNVNAAGNLRRSNTHDSGMGLFPSEVNPKFVLNSASTYFANEYYRLKTAQYGSNYSATPFPTGVVPTAPLPNPPGRAVGATTIAPPGGYVPSASAALDWDGTGIAGAMRMLLPGQQNLIGPGNAVAVSHSAFATAPRFTGPTITGTSYNRFGNGDVNDAAPVEQLQHPYFWNPYLHRPRTNSVGGAMTFTEADLRKLHAKWADDTGLTNDTLLGTLAPISLGAMKTNTTLPYLSTGPGKTPANRDRFNVTTRSNSLHLHNLTPMTANVLSADPLTKYIWAPAPAPAPIGTVQPFVDPSVNASYGNLVLESNGTATTDFDRANANVVKLRAGVGALPALDLNRPLTDYRHPLAIKYNLPLRPDNVIMPTALQLPNWYVNNGITAAQIAIYNAAPYTPDATIINNHFTVNAYTSTTLLFRAMRDRQELAKDIFARLVVATGASASYMKWNGYCQPNPLIDVGLGIAPNPEYEALRYLAQLAANIVDYVDGDDVATTFVWNPINPQVTSSFDPMTLGGLATPTGQPAPLDSNFGVAAIPNRVVVGTEKPKLTINEAYCELANDTNETGTTRAQRPLELRFLLELMNPNANDVANGNETKPYAAQAIPSNDPNQNAVLFYGPNQQIPNPFNPAAAPYSAYVVDLHVQGNAAISEWTANRANVLGSNTAVVADRRVDFAALAGVSLASPAAGYAGPNARANPKQTALYPEADPAFAGTVPVSPQAVAPVGTKYLPVAGANNVAQGYLLLAPASVTTQSNNTEFTPAAWDAGTMTYTLAGGPQYDSAVMVPADPPTPGTPTQGLTIPFGPTTPQNDDQIMPLVGQANVGAPAVMVRRLANPYLPPNDPASPAYLLTLPPNPYLMTDVMPAVHVNDGVRLGVHPTLPPPAPSNRPTNTPPRHERYSKGKGHPFAALAQLTHVTTTDPAPVLGDMPATTFFRHNGTPSIDPESPILPAPTLISPTAARNPIVTAVNNLILTNQGTAAAPRLGFEWLTHLDRPLVNEIDLLNVPAVAPHLLTLSFATGDLVTQPNPLLPNYSVRFHNHTAAWRDGVFGNPPVPVLANQSRLYRALELLRVKPWNYAMPTGGRVPGKINLNLITDPNVLKALADPQNGDFFVENLGMTDPATGLTTLDPIYNATLPRTTYDPTTIFDKLQIVRGGGTLAPLTTTNVTTSLQYDPTKPPANALMPTQIPGPNDRPLRSLGHAANAPLATAFYPAGKDGVNGTALNGVFDLSAQTNPYNKASLLRKMHNNLTTTSEVYEVYLTVGFFDVLNSGPYYTAPNFTTPQLGKEVFRDVPGDTRHKFFAIVDRTNLSLDPASAVLAGTQYSVRKQGAKPVFTDVVNLSAPVLSGTTYTSTLQFHATAGFPGQGVTIRYDQTPDEANDFPVVAGTRLKIGTGVNAEWVQVLTVPPAATVGPGGTLFDTNTGVATVTVLRNIGLPVSPTATTAPYIISPLPLGTGAGQYPELPTHPPGTAVGNVLLGNPGPQPGFDPTQPNYKSVMPYLMKLDQ
jgi:hypothetical protein